MKARSDGSSLTRRDFVRTSASAAASVSVLGSVGQGLHAAGSDTVRVGDDRVRRTGDPRRDGAPAGVPGVELVAMGDMFADRIQQSLEILRKEAPAGVKVKPDMCFTGFDAYKKVLQTDVQAVLIVTPPHFRPVHFRAAVEAGKHIFMEKPGGVDPAWHSGHARDRRPGRSRRNCRLSAARSAVTRPLTRRRSAGFTMGRSDESWPPRLTGWAATCWVIGQWYDRGDLSEIEWQCRNWPWFTWLSGDHIVEQHVHNLDVINWALNAYPEQCLAPGRPPGPELGQYLGSL